MGEERDGARLADELAAQCIEENRPGKPAESAVVERSTGRLPLIVAAVSLAVILFQIPSLRAALSPPPSLRSGVQESDPDTDACVDNLWGIAAVLREGESAEVLARLPFTEPVTHAHYTITSANGEVVVECPNPRAHGLSHLRISERSPRPEAVR